MIEGSFTRTQLASQTPFDNTSNGFVSTDVQAAIVEAKLAGSTQRFTIQLLNNGNMTNNQRFGYDALLPNTPVIVPKNCILRELAFANQAATTDARFNIYRRSPPASSPTPGVTATLLQQWTITNSLTALLSGLSYIFLAGQELLIVFVDTGDNPADASMTCFFEST